MEDAAEPDGFLFVSTFDAQIEESLRNDPDRFFQWISYKQKAGQSSSGSHTDTVSATPGFLPRKAGHFQTVRTDSCFPFPKSGSYSCQYHSYQSYLYQYYLWQNSCTPDFHFFAFQTASFLHSGLPDSCVPDSKFLAFQKDNKLRLRPPLKRNWSGILFTGRAKSRCWMR